MLPILVLHKSIFPFVLQHMSMFLSFLYSDEGTLNSLARERGFVVQDVPRDGNCLFSAVGMQLENVAIHYPPRQTLQRNVQPNQISNWQIWFDY